jgi:Uma2 family endonuclease
MSRDYSDGTSRTGYVELHNGDHMSQKQFHQIYELMPEGFRAELVDGTVFVSEPLGLEHSGMHIRLNSLFDAYQGTTPGVEAGDNATVILGKEDEVQPDIFLRILPEFGGQSQTTGRGNKSYVKGAPELIVEVAHNKWSMDFHSKRRRYQNAGVIEYLTLCLDPLELSWFSLRTDSKLVASDRGTLPSGIFPGLWIHVDALLQMNYEKLMRVLRRGLSSAGHKSFVEKLRSRGHVRY